LLRAVIAEPSTFAREALTKQGIDEKWAVTWRSANARAGGVGQGGSLQPYRGGAARATAKVILWNDSRSTMEGVIGVLQEVFEMSEPEAMYTMLLVHEGGRTTACWCDDDEATRLVERATRAARDRGMPLRVTIEPMPGKRRGASAER